MNAHIVYLAVILFLLLCLTPPLLAQESISWEWDDSETTDPFHKPVSVESWQLMKDEFDIQLYLGEVAGTNVKAFKGIMHINSSINSILAVMINTEACPQWVHDCATSFLVADNGIRDRYVYQNYDLMFPAGKRDYLFYASVTQNPASGAVTIHMEATPHYCRKNDSPPCRTINQTGNIMIQESTGTYLLEPLDDGSTRVTWEQFTDPAGDLPTFIVNQLVLNVPFMTLKGLQDIVRKPRYQMSDTILKKDLMFTATQGE